MQGEQDFNIAASPAESILIAGTATTVAVQPTSTGTRAYTGLLDLAVSNLPTGITARLQPATLNTSQSGAIVFTASASAAPGRHDVLVQASGQTSTGRQTKSASLTLVVQAASGVKGRFITPDGRPVAGVLVRVDATQTATDAAGNFLLTGLPSGPVTLRFDATPAHPLYPIWPYSLTLQSGQIAVIADWTINPPPADEAFVPIANATQAQTLTDPRFPDFAITLPAGASIIGWDGVPKTRIAVERIALDKLPVPAPPVPIKEAYQLYFGTPMGGIPSQPIPVTLPNVTGLDPGQQTEIWFFDGSPMGGSGEWKLAGLGTISADGKRVASNPGVGIPRFCGVCGLFATRCPDLPTGDRPSPDGGCNTAGNPVELFSGYEMPNNGGLSCNGLTPLELGLSYHPVDAFQGRGGLNGSVGEGWVLDHDVVLADAAQVPGSKRLLLPPHSRINFAQQANGTYTAQDDPRFFGAVLSLISGSAREWQLRFKDGRQWRFGLTDATGLTASFLIETTDAQGNATQITRRADRKITAIGTAQRAYTLSYGANGYVREIRDPAERTLSLTYTAANRIETVTDAQGGVTRYTYVGDDEHADEPLCPQGTDGQRIKTIRYPGRPDPTENFHGPSRRVLRQTGYDGREHRYAYKLAGACVTHVNNPGTRCTGATCPDTDSWDNHQAGWRIRGGQVIATTVTRPDGSSTTKRYNAIGLTSERIDAHGQALLNQRDADNRITRQTDALGRVTRSSFDAQGNVTRSIDPLGRITDITYDSRWAQPTSITRYDSDGSPVTTLMAYGSNGRPTRSTNPLGQSTTYEYTPQGQLAALTDALGNRSEFGYNAAGDLITGIDPLGNDSRLAHDAIGRPTQSTDPLGYSSSTQYNALDQPTQSTDPLGGTTRYGYDAANRLTSVTNALNRATERYGYDAGDRLIQRTDALGRSEAMTYDAMNRVATSTDRNGQVSRYSHDAEGRLTRIQRADGTLSIGYDAIGRVQRIEDTASGGSTIGYDYDNADRLTRETQSTAAGSHVIAYEYDTLDRRTRRTVNGTEATTYGWDRAGRLTSIGYQGQTTSYAYDAAGRLTTKTLPNGIVQTHSYDNASRLAGITYANGATVIEAITYSYDANGRRTSKTSASNSTAQETGFSASYDDADRMMAVTLRGTGAGGTDESCTLAYDPNGNLATKACGANSTSYSWDAQNRLTGISAAATTASFGYDALGRRTTRTVNGTTTTYVYDGAQAIAETKGGINATLLTGLQIDEVIARYSGSGNRTMLTDALGSVIAEARSDRSIASRREYTPFGQVTSTGEASANDSQYTARENDGTGLYFYRARYYDAQLKRFISQDPIGLDGGVNQSAYVGGDPVSYVDPTGECPWCVAAGIGALTDLTIQLYFNGFNLKCVNWKEVFVSGAAAGLGVGIAAKLAKLGKLGTYSTQTGGPTRPTYRFFKSKGNVRVESHPISRNAPDWYSYPHWHPDFAGAPLSKMHWPLIEPLIGIPAAAYNAAKDDCECNNE